MIDITGCDLAKVAQAAYDLSHAQGMGMMHYRAGTLTDDEAAALVRRCEGRSDIALSLDYVMGRACKLTVFRNGDRLEIDDRWFDHSARDHAELLERIRATIPAASAAE